MTPQATTLELYGLPVHVPTLKDVDGQLVPADACLLRCPACGSDYTHQVRTVYHRRSPWDNPQASSQHVVIHYDPQTTEPLPANASRRRDSLTVEFSCEECGDTFTLVIAQHKGQTHVVVVPPTSSARSHPVGVPSRLPTGAWGVLLPRGDLQVGDTVVVRTLSGHHWETTISAVHVRTPTSMLCETTHSRPYPSRQTIDAYCRVYGGDARTLRNLTPFIEPTPHLSCLKADNDDPLPY